MTCLRHVWEFQSQESLKLRLQPLASAYHFAGICEVSALTEKRLERPQLVDILHMMYAKVLQTISTLTAPVLVLRSPFRGPTRPVGADYDIRCKDATYRDE